MKLWHYIVSTLLAVSVAAFAVACNGGGDDGGDPTPTAQRSPSAQPTARTPRTTAASPTAVSDNVALPRVVSQAIDLMLAGDYAAVEELFAFQMVACAVDVTGAGGPPECEADETDGTEVEVLPVSQCEGAYLRPRDVFFAFRLRDQRMQLFGVYDAANADIFPAGAYALLFSYVRPETPEMTLTVELLTSDAGVTGVNFGCGEDPATLVAQQALGDAIVTPGAQ